MSKRNFDKLWNKIVGKKSLRQSEINKKNEEERLALLKDTNQIKQYVIAEKDTYKLIYDVNDIDIFEVIKFLNNTYSISQGNFRGITGELKGDVTGRIFSDIFTEALYESGKIYLKNINAENWSEIIYEFFIEDYILMRRKVPSTVGGYYEFSYFVPIRNQRKLPVYSVGLPGTTFLEGTQLAIAYLQEIVTSISI